MPYSPYVSSTVSSKNREKLQQIQKSRLQIRRHIEINSRLRSAQDDEMFENTALGAEALSEVEQEIEKEPNEGEKEFRKRKIQAVKNKIQELKKKAAAKMKSELANKTKQAIKKTASKLVSPAVNWAKEAAAQIAKQVVLALARAAWMLLAAIIGAIGIEGVIVILIVIIVVVAAVVVNDTCNTSWISSAICSAASWISKFF